MFFKPKQLTQTMRKKYSGWYVNQWYTLEIHMQCISMSIAGCIV